VETPTPEDLELVDAARTAIAACFDEARYVTTVAAAVRDRAGAIHVGVNLYHFTGGPCAELVALANARAAGAQPSTIVAVAGDGRGVLAPCGKDRQVFADYFPGLRVVVPGAGGPVVALVAELLPQAYLTEE
jgi:cytidine deaminase